MRALAALTLLVACHRDRPALTSCAESLGGMWHAPSGDWMLIDRGAHLQGYPQFSDLDVRDGAAPRAVDLVRSDDGGVRGELHRRFTRDGKSCVSRVPLRVTTCRGRAVDVVLSDPDPASSFAPCTFSLRQPLSRRERWSRIR